MNSPTIKQPNISTTFPYCDCSTQEDHDSNSSPCRSADHWRYAISNIRKSLFNSSSCAIPSPASHLMQYERELRKSRNNQPLTQYQEGRFGQPLYSFNSDPLASRDIFEYRISRSEHLILRLLQFFAMHGKTHSYVRISPGIFLVQKYEECRTEFPSPRTISNALDFFGQNCAPIDTLTFSDLYNSIMQQRTQPRLLSNTFIPYTYTLGVRFTNPYKKMRDVLVRGNIPLWCQTLFITECVRLLPIEQGMTLKGILPFAKDVEFTFGSLQFDDPYPDLLIMFERFAMELSDPHMMYEVPPNELCRWKNRQLNILDGVLYCEIPDETAMLVTNLADAWATSQGMNI
ncbi:uncharacterized protein EV154DRAFT_49183 [Mucor mucedo]|uniref:uncharacterized protein n=1 Tax=Mucor mucedo TaxID=29922 RepID=UPI00221FDF72|nr:uncharacterized protein EV154DRAFT_49183 [Mucor mucedo]KAI7894991.1 hypothetical protein EV154DRAFT_49183 [Mucor mucedo]